VAGIPRPLRSEVKSEFKEEGGGTEENLRREVCGAKVREY